MTPAIDRLLRSYRGGSLSRRRLAAGLSSALGAQAAPSLMAGALGPPATPWRPATRAVFRPQAAGGGADDRQALQAAINAAALAGGGQVLIEDHLSIGSPLTVRDGVELAGTGRIGSSICALPSFSGGSLIVIEVDARHVAFRSLTLDTGGLAHGITFGSGSSRVRVSGVRVTGWHPATPWFIGINVDPPTNPSGPDSPVRDVVVEGCDFDQLGNGVRIAKGASNVAVLGCRFRGMRRRGIWLTGSGSLSSSHIHISGNTLMEFPLDPDLSYPIAIGDTGDQPHDYVHINRNVIIGNGSFNGPGGFGTGDHISMQCLRRSQVVCNASIDGAEVGFAIADCSDLLLLGNVAIASDGPGFILKAKTERCLRVQFIANYVGNNAQNRQGSNLHDWVKSGFLVRGDGNNVVDTHFLGNYSWDDQPVKTQNYALALAHDTVHTTLLTGNFWRPTMHGMGTVYNRGRGTRQAVYEWLPRISG